MQTTTKDASAELKLLDRKHSGQWLKYIKGLEFRYPIPNLFFEKKGLYSLPFELGTSFFQSFIEQAKNPFFLLHYRIQMEKHVGAISSHYYTFSEPHLSEIFVVEKATKQKDASAEQQLLDRKHSGEWLKYIKGLVCPCIKKQTNKHKCLVL